MIGAAALLLFLVGCISAVYFVAAPLWHALVRRPMATRIRAK